MTDIVYERTGVITPLNDWPDIGPSIDGENLLLDILDVFGYSFEGNTITSKYSLSGVVHDLVFTIGVHVQHGDLDYTPGEQGYSEMTDWVLDRMMVGDVDLIEVLDQYNGRMVTVRVDTGPSYKIG